MGNVNSRNVDFNAEANLLHFHLLRSVGRGSFGKVRIVEHKITKRQYALKYISKKECIHMDALRNIFRERNILESIDHPYVCNLRFSFQDDDYMYMVADLMLGGDLRFHLLRKPCIKEEEARHWIAELACGINYLHSRKIVHRDIKPDNVLLDQEGHCHLTDFNIATQFDSRRLLTSESGTYAYMAPEMFNGKGYKNTIDWWSLGVVLYEAMYGKRPFDASSNEALKHAIQTSKVHFPPVGRKGLQLSRECIEVMRKFLERDPSKRLCCSSDGWLELRKIAFFDGIDWDLLEKKQVTPPFKPNCDKGNFDVAYDLEELLMEQDPLEAKPRRKTDLSLMSKEMQLIERRFKNFDHLLYERYSGFVDPERLCVGDPPSWVKCVDSKKSTVGQDSGIGQMSRSNSEECIGEKSNERQLASGRRDELALRKRSVNSLKNAFNYKKKWALKLRKSTGSDNSHQTSTNVNRNCQSLPQSIIDQDCLTYSPSDETCPTPVHMPTQMTDANSSSNSLPSSTKIPQLTYSQASLSASSSFSAEPQVQRSPLRQLHCTAGDANRNDVRFFGQSERF